MQSAAAATNAVIDTLPLYGELVLFCIQFAQAQRREGNVNTAATGGMRSADGARNGRRGSSARRDGQRSKQSVAQMADDAQSLSERMLEGVAGVVQSVVPQAVNAELLLLQAFQAALQVARTQNTQLLEALGPEPLLPNAKAVNDLHTLTSDIGIHLGATLDAANDAMLQEPGAVPSTMNHARQATILLAEWQAMVESAADQIATMQSMQTVQSNGQRDGQRNGQRRRSGGQQDGQRGRRTGQQQGNYF